MNPEILEQQPSKEGDVVFDAPWQARTFAMAVKLHEAGVFSWSEWSDQLSRTIAESEARDHNAVTSSNDYYTCWQQTLERLVREKTDV